MGAATPSVPTRRAGPPPPVGEEWPDWSGQACAIVASGPSTRAAEVALLKGRLKVLAIKRCVELAPWADAVYGCDRPWWRSVRGLPDFPGLKLAYADRAVDEFGLRKVAIPDPKGCRLLMDQVGVVGSGGSSGFQALNLAVQFGARRILLLGFDCDDRSGVHWYGRNMWPGAGNPAGSNFRRWVEAFHGIAGALEDLGVEVINAAPNSAIKAWPRMSVAEALARWNLMEPAAA